MYDDTTTRKLKKDLIIIGNEISQRWSHQDLFWRLFNITNNNKRVVEIGGDYLFRSLSMMNFLVEVQKNLASFTREDSYCQKPWGRKQRPKVWSS